MNRVVVGNQQQMTSIKWQSPSNIALIKYWGKKGIQLPMNASLSMSLNRSVTRTELKYTMHKFGFNLKYYFEGKRHVAFEKKVQVYLQKLNKELPFLKDFQLEIHSENTFPHSTGIASSASSMSALALCLVSMEEKVMGVDLDKREFFQRASYFARLGSGSAARSVYGGWSIWGEFAGIESSNMYASKLDVGLHSDYKNMCDAVLLVSSKPKKVSSSLGHHLMNKHPFAAARYKQAKGNMSLLIESMKTNDFELFARIVEDEALTLHALLMTSSSDGLLMKPNSLEIIEAVRRYRAESGTRVCFTLDAGPNIHLIYPNSEKIAVKQFIESELINFCENGRWIDDEMGNGPINIE